ncbi:hypothetical protein JOM56_004916 [Amanita muscaria]
MKLQVKISSHNLIADLSCKALLIYDFLLVFSEEVSLIWPSPWTLVKVLYILSRYVPFIDTVISIHDQFTLNLTVAQCKTGYYITGAMYVFGMRLNEAILTFRIWLLWGKNKKLSIGLPILFTVMWGTDFLLMTLSTKTFSFFELPYPLNRGCALLSGDRMIAVGWVSILLYNTVTLVLVLMRAISFSKLGIRSQLLRRLYINCIYYYLFLFLISVINTSLILLRDDHLTTLASISRSLHSIVSNRVILDIRREVVTPPWNESGSELSSLEDWD